MLYHLTYKNISVFRNKLYMVLIKIPFLANEFIQDRHKAMLWQFSDDHEFTKEIAIISEFYVMFKFSSIFLWSIDVYVLVFELVNNKGIYDYIV